MEDVTFRADPRYVRSMRRGTLTLPPLTAMLTVAAFRWEAAGAFAIITGATAVMCLYYFLLVARAYTTCTPGGLVVRRLGRPQEFPWPEVSSIVVRVSVSAGVPGPVTFQSVRLRTASGRTFRLAVPVPRGRGDTRFRADAAEIDRYWRVMTGRAAGPVATEFPVTVTTRLMRWFYRLFLPVGMIALLAVTLPQLSQAWSAHLGHGQPGTFTAAADHCSRGSCAWYGTFEGRDLALRYGSLAAGGRIRRAGDTIRALYPGSGTYYYPAGGGTDWIKETGFLAAEVIALAVWCGWALRRLRRRSA